jgi:hypothetical protein
LKILFFSGCLPTADFQQILGFSLTLLLSVTTSLELYRFLINSGYYQLRQLNSALFQDQEFVSVGKNYFKGQ